MTNTLARFHRRIAEKARDNAAPTVFIAALGDSVTAGSGNEGEFLHDFVYHAQLKCLLEAKFSQCVFSVLNAGVNGQNAVGGMAVLERDVLPRRPDLLLIGFGLNDATGGELPGLPEFAAALEKLIVRARQGGIEDIILLTSNMMPRRDNDKIPERWRHVTQQFIHLQSDGILAAYAQCVREVGKQNNVAVADVYAAWEQLEASGVDTTALRANGLNHPDASGHELAAGVILKTIVDNAPEASL